MRSFTTDFSLEELAQLARYPDVDADALYPEAWNWADEAWVRVGSGPHRWWLGCSTCDRLYILWSPRNRAVYYRHGGRMIRTPLVGLFYDADASALERWVQTSCSGPTGLYVPESAPGGGLVLVGR